MCILGSAGEAVSVLTLRSAVGAGSSHTHSLTGARRNVAVSGETGRADTCISCDVYVSQNILILISFQPLKNVKPFLALEPLRKQMAAGLGPQNPAPGHRGMAGSGRGDRAHRGLNPGSAMQRLSRPHAGVNNE